MINNYLRELVYTHYRVIIPDFGAFLKKNKAAVSLEDAITFSPFLRFNDGLLENFVIEKESVPKEQAAEAVRLFVQKIKQTIVALKPYYIEGLGAFYQDNRGIVQFFFAKTEQKMSETFLKIREEMGVGASSFVNEKEEVETPQEPINEAETPTETPIDNEDDEKNEDVKVIDMTNGNEVEVIKSTNLHDKENGKMQKEGSAVANPTVNVHVNVHSDREKAAENERVHELEIANAKLEVWKQVVEERKAEEKEKEKLEEEKLKAKEEKEKEEEDNKEKERDEKREGEFVDIAARALQIQRDKLQAFERKKAEQEGQKKEEPQPDFKAPIARQPDIIEDEEEEDTWIPEDMPQYSTRKNSVWLLLLIVLVMGVAGALFFWGAISETLFDGDGSVEVSSVSPLPATANNATSENITFIPAVSQQQKGICYLAVVSFKNVEQAIETCQVLSRLGYKPEIVVTFTQAYTVCIARASSADYLNEQRIDYVAKYGTAWILQ